MYKVLVVSVFHNREALVSRSIKSIAEQLTDDMHLLLIDDGSTDTTYEELRKWASDQITVRTQENTGFVRTMIAAIASIESEYVAVHGSGDISLPGRFARQVAVLDSKPSVGVVGCHIEARLLDSDKPGKIMRCAIDKDEEQLMLTTNPFSHGEVMFRRSYYDTAGGYRGFFRYAQDRDLWCRMSHLCKFEVIQDVLYQRMAYVPGSVSGDPQKTLQQLSLSAFAVHCHKVRLSQGIDPLNTYGETAFKQFRPGFDTTLVLFRKALGGFVRDDERAYITYKDVCKGNTRIFHGIFGFIDAFPALSKRLIRSVTKNYIR